MKSDGKTSVRSEPGKTNRKVGGTRPASGRSAGGQSAVGGSEGVDGRNQLRPNIVNISIKHGTGGSPIEDSRGTRMSGKYSPGRLRALGYGGGGGQFTGHGGNVCEGHVRCDGGVSDGQVHVRSAQPKGFDREGELLGIEGRESGFKASCRIPRHLQL